MNKLNLDQKSIDESRGFASAIAKDVQSFINERTTVAVERTVCRLLGIDGVDKFDVPVPNLLVDEAVKHGDLSLGISTYLGSALLATQMTLPDFVSAFMKHETTLCDHPLASVKQIKAVLAPYLHKTLEKIQKNKQDR